MASFARRPAGFGQPRSRRKPSAGRLAGQCSYCARCQHRPHVDLDQPGKPLIKSYHEALNHPAATQRAQESAARVIAQLQQELAGSDWFKPDYVQKVIERAPQAFSDALERWRVLFDATRTQMNMADQIVKSHTASHSERQNAQRRYGDLPPGRRSAVENG